MKRVCLVLFFIFMVACLITSFAEGSDAAEVPSLSLDQTEILIAKGSSTKLAYTLEGVQKAKIIWESSDKTIASVNGGNVRGVNEGTAIITCVASIQNEKIAEASCTINVYTGISSIKIKASNNIIHIGESSEPLNVTITPENATYKDVIWTSSDETVAMVDSHGVVTGKKPGKVKVTCSSNQPNDAKPKTAVCQITVQQQVERIRLDQESFSLVQKKSATIKASVLPDSAANKKLQWKSSDEFVAKVANGRVTAQKPGKCVISAISTDGTEVVATCEVVVIDDKAWGEMATKYLQLFDCRKYKELNSKSKKAKYAVLLYNEALEYFDLTHDTASKDALMYIVQQASLNGKIYIGAGSMGTPISVSFVDNNKNCIFLMGWTSQSKIMYNFWSDMGENGGMNTPQRVDIAEFRKYFEMEPKKILADLE